MKLTQRDRIMLSVLSIALVLFVGIWFVLRPAFKEVQSNKAEYNDLRSEYQKKQTELEAALAVKDDVLVIYDECVDLASNFYDYDLAYNISEDVYDIVTESDITMTSMSINHSAKSLKGYTYGGPKTINIPLDEYANVNGIEEEVDVSTAVPSQTVGCYSFNIGFKNTTREKIFAFIENLKTQNQKTLIVTSLSFNVTQADSEEGYNGNVSLELYYIDPPDEPIMDD